MDGRNGTLDALKAQFKPFPVEVVIESGGTVTLWSLPMRYDFWAEKVTREQITERLKAAGLDGDVLADAMNYELIVNFCKEHLVNPPQDAAKGFQADERPEPLFADVKEISATLSYSAILGAHRRIQQKGFSVVGEAALKNS
jgi:hypothetical protein